MAFQERSRSLDEERCGSFTRHLHLRVPGMSRARLASLELLLAPLAPPSAINTSAPAAPPAALVLSLLPTHSLHSSLSLPLSLSIILPQTRQYVRARQTPADIFRHLANVRGEIFRIDAAEQRAFGLQEQRFQSSLMLQQHQSRSVKVHIYSQGQVSGISVISFVIY